MAPLFSLSSCPKEGARTFAKAISRSDAGRRARVMRMGAFGTRAPAGGPDDLSCAGVKNRPPPWARAPTSRFSSGMNELERRCLQQPTTTSDKRQTDVTARFRTSIPSCPDDTVQCVLTSELQLNFPARVSALARGRPRRPSHAAGTVRSRAEPPAQCPACPE